MKKVLIAIFPWLLTALGFDALAQEDVKETDKKERQEIVIRKNGDKDANITINISGDKVTVNGKPLMEFKDDAITINKRNIVIHNGKDRFVLGEGLRELESSLDNLSWDDGDNKTTAFLGVTTEKVSEGAKITEITQESAASKAGLKEGDIITKVGDDKIDGSESLSKAIKSKMPKDEVKIHYLRDGKDKSVKATLQEKKVYGKVFSYSSPDGSMKTLTIPEARAYSDAARAYSDEARAFSDMARENFAITAPGTFGDNYSFSVAGFPRKKLGLKIQDTEEGNGVKVLEVSDSSAASTAGLKKDDIITQIGNEKVTNTDEAREQLMENSDKNTYTIKARRNGTEMSFDIKIPKKLKTANL